MITSGNPASFSLTADSGADDITGVVTLGSLLNGASDSAFINGFLTVGSVTYGSSATDLQLESLISTDLGGAITVGETLGLTIQVAGCNTSGSPAICIAIPDPTGTVAAVGLAPAVPEPATAGLLGAGLGALLFAKRRLTGRVS